MSRTLEIKQPLPELPCPLCGGLLRARDGQITPSKSWSDCLRRCPRCRVGYSNARRNPTILFDDPGLNVPPEVRGGVSKPWNSP